MRKTDYLAHHGIKGQRWGHRNGPPYPIPYSDHSSSEKKEKWQYSLNRNTNNKSVLKKIADYSTAAGKLSFSKKKHASGNANKASSKTTGPLKERLESPFKKAGIMSQQGIHSSDIKTHKLFTARKLGDSGIRITKGQIVQHVMSTPVKDLTNRDYLFVAATEADKKNYGGFFAALTKYRNSADTMYKMEMTAMTDIVSPSKKERVQTFIDIYKKDPVRVATQLAEFNKRNYGGQYKETTEELVKKYSHMSMHQLKNMGYYTYANSWFDPEAGTLKDMRSVLEKKGYNAIIDDNDKRSFVQSEAPLIVFDIMKNLGNTKVSELTQQEIRRNMIDWQNMKHAEEVDSINQTEYLAHHGIKGMKWGVRRFQKKNGGYTPLGKKRRSAKDMTDEELASGIRRGRLEENYNKLYPNPSGLDRSKKVLDASSNLANQIKNINREYSNKRPKSIDIDLSNMSDDELRAKINRANMERQYKNILAEDSASISSGREYMSKIIDGTASALAIGSSAVGLALAIKELRK